MATWRWSEKIDLLVTYRHSSNLANVERKHNSGVKKRTSKDCKETKCHRTVKSDCRLFQENKSLKSKSKDYCQLENCLFSHQHLSKKVEDKFLSLLREKDLNKVDAREKKGFQHTLWTPFMWQCDFETSTLRKSLLSRTWHKSVCNHGTGAMMAVTMLPSKMSASSRRLNSILDTARLKHTISLTNPSLLVRILEMVAAVPHGNFTSTKAFKMQKSN